MKFLRSVLYVFSLAGLSVIVTNCTKEEDPEKIRKEALTFTLNEDINADSLEAYVTWMQGFGTRFALSDSHRNVAVKIKNKFIQMGYTDTKIDSFWINKTYKNVNYQQWQYNVIATLEGSTASDSISVMGGHYDNYLGTGDPFTILPGANDNASGVAAALEVARVMKKNNYIPKNTIQFIARNYYAYDARTTLKRIKIMLNNDMIAYEPDNNKANWSVNIIDYDNSHSIRAEAQVLCAKFTILKYFNDNTYNRSSDSYPFFTNGYMALFFFSKNMDPTYHSLNDVVANCNFEYCREIVKLNCAILVDKN
jgi:Zn-dependent M28 family amino/carboxypeptidase